MNKYLKLLVKSIGSIIKVGTLGIICILLSIIPMGCAGVASDMKGTEFGSTASVSVDNAIENNGIALDMNSESNSESTYENVNYTPENKEDNISSEISLNEEKLVYKCDIRIETTEYEKSYSAIKSALEEVKGIIQYENQSDNAGRWYYNDYEKTSGTLVAEIECRIPTEKYEEFINSVGNTGKVMNKSTSIDNISQKYHDTDTRIKTLKVQEERVLAMLESASTIEEMLSIEERLENIRYEIESLETNLIAMDMDVAYSYVNIELEEVMEYSETYAEEGFIGELVYTVKNSAKSFLDFCKNITVVIIYLAPYIIIAGLVIIILCKIRKVKVRDFFKRKRGKEIKELTKKSDDITKK